MRQVYLSVWNKLIYRHTCWTNWCLFTYVISKNRNIKVDLLLYAGPAARAPDAGVLATVHRGTQADDVIRRPGRLRRRKRQVQLSLLRTDQLVLCRDRWTSSSTNWHLQCLRKYISIPIIKWVITPHYLQIRGNCKCIRVYFRLRCIIPIGIKSIRTRPVSCAIIL